MFENILLNYSKKVARPVQLLQTMTWSQLCNEIYFFVLSSCGCFVTQLHIQLTHFFSGKGHFNNYYWSLKKKQKNVLHTLKALRTANGSSAVSLCRRAGQQRWAIGSSSFSLSLSTYTHSSSTSNTLGQRQNLNYFVHTTKCRCSF